MSPAPWPTHTLISRSTASPQPLAISGRESWSGNDGNWSVIPIQVGSSKEVFQVLVSITSSNTLLPLPDYCLQSNITNCGAARGVDDSNGFLTSNSSSWNASLSVNQGWDTIDLSFVGGPILDQQPITGIDSATPFLGSLRPRPQTVKLFATRVLWGKLVELQHSTDPEN
jgi:hypothetical protein